MKPEEFARKVVNTFDYKFSDVENILPPVDVHDVRIAFLLGYTQTDQMTQKNIG